MSTYAPSFDVAATKWGSVLFDMIPVAVFGLDQSLEIVWTSPGVTHLLGYEPGELDHHSVLWLLHPEDLERIAPVALAAVSDAAGLTAEHSAASNAEIDVRARHRDGRWVPVSVIGRAVNDEGDLIVVARDASERAAMAKVIERVGLGATLDDSLTSVAELVNASFETDQATIVHDCDGVQVLPLHQQGLVVDPVAVLDAVRSEDSSSGTVIESDDMWMTSIESADGRVAGAIVVPVLRTSGATMFDVEVLGRLRHLANMAVTRWFDDQALRRDASYDHLTGLLTRREFERALSQDLDHLEDRQVTVLFVDLDGFKGVNDRHGHTFGDAVLSAAAGRIREAVREADVVGRLGGDEFGVLCRSTDSSTLPLVAARIRELLRQPIVVDGVEIRISGSIGQASTAEPTSVADLLRRADAAMYVEKQHRSS